MNKHLDDYLCKKYPLIFAERNLPMTETCLCWGLETGDGWFFLLDALCSSIQNYIDNPRYVYEKTFKAYCIRIWNWLAKHLHVPYRWHCYGIDIMEPEQKIPQVVAVQVKEKFGGLRFYYYGGDEYIRGMVSLAESLSYRICEECGVMNELVNRNSVGWIQTTCPCCVRAGMKENHTEHRRQELVEVWEKVRKDEFPDQSKEMKAALQIVKEVHDRSKKTV